MTLRHPLVFLLVAIVCFACQPYVWDFFFFCMFEATLLQLIVLFVLLFGVFLFCSL